MVWNNNKGGNWKKGGGKGGWNKKQSWGKRRSLPNMKDVVVDEKKKYKGKFVYFNRASGFGFIQLHDDGVIPENKVMAHWKALKSDDRWPFAHQNLEVELTLVKERNTVRAANVSLPGGKAINLQDGADEKFEFVGQKNMRFLGKVKFYRAQDGYGYVTLEPGYDISADVSNEIKIERIEISSGNDAPRLRTDMAVEFGIMKKKGKYFCYNMSLPGGDDITRHHLEGRTALGNATYSGTIQFWNHWKGFGYIKPDSMSKLPGKAQTALNEQLTKAKEKAGADKSKTLEPLIWFRRADRAEFDHKIANDCKVKFKLYSDNKAVGACDVAIQG